MEAVKQGSAAVGLKVRAGSGRVVEWLRLWAGGATACIAAAAAAAAAAAGQWREAASPLLARAAGMKLTRSRSLLITCHARSRASTRCWPRSSARPASCRPTSARWVGGQLDGGGGGGKRAAGRGGAEPGSRSHVPLTMARARADADCMRLPPAAPPPQIFRIDGHMGIAISGLTADGRILCRYMRNECLNHRWVWRTAGGHRGVQRRQGLGPARAHPVPEPLVGGGQVAGGQCRQGLRPAGARHVPEPQAGCVVGRAACCGVPLVQCRQQGFGGPGCPALPAAMRSLPVLPSPRMHPPRHPHPSDTPPHPPPLPSFVYDSPMPLGRLVRQLADKAQVRGRAGGGRRPCAAARRTRVGVPPPPPSRCPSPVACPAAPRPRSTRTRPALPPAPRPLPCPRWARSARGSGRTGWA